MIAARHDLRVSGMRANACVRRAPPNGCRSTPHRCRAVGTIRRRRLPAILAAQSSRGPKIAACSMKDVPPATFAVKAASPPHRCRRGRSRRILRRDHGRGMSNNSANSGCARAPSSNCTLDRNRRRRVTRSSTLRSDFQRCACNHLRAATASNGGSTALPSAPPPATRSTPLAVGDHRATARDARGHVAKPASW